MIIKRRNFILIALFFIVLTFAGIQPVSAAGSAFQVTNLSDSGPGSLRQAISDANLTPEPDTIEFSDSLADSTITLTSGQLDVTQPLNIDGRALNLTISGNGASRIIMIEPTAGIFSMSGITIAEGSADYGGGIYNDSSHITLTNVLFYHNVAIRAGGGMFNKSGDGLFDHVTFHGNSVYYNEGGGLYNHFGNPIMRDVVFSSNVSETGGGMCNDAGTPVMTNVIFKNNATSQPNTVGGGLHSYGGNFTITNALFVNNTANGYGGGISLYGGNPILTGVTFYGNSDGSKSGGGALYGGGNSPIITNSIIWGCGDAPVENTNTNGVSYSLVQGGYAGTGNIDTDPLFVDSSSSDFHLQTSSPAIGVGSNAAATSARITTDLDGHQRISGTIVDMGAYEFQETNVIFGVGAGSGSVSANVSGSPIISGQYVPAGADVRLAADPDSGWNFDHWKVNGINYETASILVTVKENIEAYAYFTKERHSSSSSGNLTPVTKTVPSSVKMKIGSPVIWIDSSEFILDTAPYIDKLTSRTMVPVRFVQYLGVEVKWLQEKGQVQIVSGGTEILLTVGSRTAVVNGKEIEMDSAVMIKDSRAFVPVRAISNFMNMKVDWDGITQEILITD